MAEYTPGGRAIGFTATVDLRLRKGDWITTKSKEFVGQVVNYKIEKNKTYKRMRSGSFDFYYAENPYGIEVSHNDNFKSIVILGIERDIIAQGGAWFFLNKGTEHEIKFQGKDALIDYLRENPEIIDQLRDIILDLDIKQK